MKTVFLLLFVLFALIACNPSIEQNQLYGKWNYTKIENLANNELLPEYELAVQSPYIIFSKTNDFKIVWGTEVLSSGKFGIDGNKILITENLPSGNTRQFPFLVSKFDGKNIVFETLSKDGSRVAAVKE